MTRLLLALSLALSLSACDQLQQRLLGEDPAAKAAKQEADGKAVGGACRHSGRAIEDCYSIYHWLPKAPIFAGWQDMDAYMRSNKIESVEPQLPPPQPPGPKKKVEKAASEEAGEKSAANSDKGDKGGKAEKAEKAEKSEKPAK